MTDQVSILQTLQPVLATLAESGMAAAEGALARIWLVGPGDVCDSCPARAGCPSQVTCLHLVASAGDELEERGSFSRVPIGAGTLGRIPVSHEPLIARSGLPALGVAEPAWLSRHPVRALAAIPLEHGERCIGVLAVYSTGDLPEGQLRLLTATARLGAEAVGNVSAYRVLAADRNRLAARNARLRSGLGLPPEPAPVPPRPAPDPATAPRPTPATVPPPATPAPFAASGAMLHMESAVPVPVRSFAEVQREGILRALERTGWRVSGPKGVAVILGLRPTTLESKMKKLGLHRPSR